MDTPATDVNRNVEFSVWSLFRGWFLGKKANININTQKPEKCHLFRGNYEGNKTEEMIYTAILYNKKVVKLSISEAD